MDISFRWHLLAACHHGRSGVGRRENIQWLIQSWRMEEGRQIDQEVCGEFERAGNMVHSLLCIVAHDKRIRSQRLLAVVTPLLQARSACQTKMGVVYDEHLVFLPHLKHYQRTRSSPTAHACHRSSVGNGPAVDKRVSHGSLPIFAHYVTRWSLRAFTSRHKTEKYQSMD